MNSPTTDHDAQPALRIHLVRGRDGSEVRINARLLGFGSSQEDEHVHASQDEEGPLFVGRGQRCSACRWFEVRIFQDETPGNERWLVQTVGRSIVPDEQDFARLYWTGAAHEVVNTLTVFSSRRSSSADVQQPMIPRASRTALAHAAEHDERLEHAYVNRAVA